MRRTAIELADGRELIYFDLPGDPGRVLKDRRDLPEPPPASELRYDELAGEWVAVAAHRQSRAFLPPADECPLCPSTETFLSEIPGPYRVAVFENRYPSFSDRVGHIEPGPRSRAGEGRCEVVCFTSDHDSSFSRLSTAEVRLVVDAWADRTEAFSKLPGIEQVFPFENRGEEIGVTLHHPHGQIYGYPFVPPHTERVLAALEKNPDAFADRLERERSAERVVAANDHWTAFVPEAARWPFEVHLHPHRGVPDLPALTDDERDAFAALYPEVLRRLDAVFDVQMPYISGWFQAPVNRARDTFRLHLRLFSVRRAPGKLKYLAGSESAMGAFVNDVPPERSAALLREAKI
ncbi:galactose-1-phosphate uridylyltransferase [Actinocorallia longicatena]|uniref:Galactose-1-phosphate uridylyltransferase n=1 Tax=Actinocorallia longicatena TaxID=111803 RepID=A0ABP6QL11_9ACTN